MLGEGHLLLLCSGSQMAFVLSHQTTQHSSRVDGNVDAEKKLAGKPAPETYEEAARMLETLPEQAVVIEDAISGVQAGRTGGFGLVIGVARGDDPEVLRQNGADFVIRDLAELSLV